MTDKRDDDPRQVLGIINSLGIVGVTASELKVFMKELKLYRKAKERKYRTEVSEENVSNTQHKLNKSESISCKNDLKKVITSYDSMAIKNEVDKKYSSSTSESTTDDITNKSISKLVVSFKTSKSRCRKTFDQESENSQTNTVTSQQKKESKGSKVVKGKQGSQTSSSGTRSRDSGSQAKSLSNKKLICDPVVLYNKYNNYWKHVFIPGQKNQPRTRNSAKKN